MIFIKMGILFTINKNLRNFVYEDLVSQFQIYFAGLLIASPVKNKQINKMEKCHQFNGFYTSTTVRGKKTHHSKLLNS